MPKIILRPSGQVIETDEKSTVLECLRKNNIYIKSSCGGVATCGDCMAKVVSGEDHISPPTFGEIKLLGNVFHITKERLTCQMKITGDICLDIAHQDESRDQLKRKKKSTQFIRRPAKVVEEKRQAAKVEKDREDKEREEKEAQEARDNNMNAHDKWRNKAAKSEDGQGGPSKNMPKRLGGNRRPRPFKVPKDDRFINDDDDDQ